MAHAVHMPMPGQMTEECVLSMWRKAEGEAVAKGDVLFEIETDKSTMEVESFHDGVLLARLVDEGATVPVNTVCAWIGEPGEAVPDVPASSAAVEPDVAHADAGAPDPVQAPPAPAPVATTAPASNAPISDIAGARLAISPRAMARATAAGVDPRSIVGSGPSGRIVERDVAAAVAAAANLATTTASTATPPARTDALEDGVDVPRPLSRMRRIIAERLTLSATTVPTFTLTVTADVTRLIALRDELRDAGRLVSVTDVVLFATAQTLAEFPDVNSRTDGVSVWPRRRVHLGMAIALAAGLVVAVIRDADRLGLLELHDEAARLVAGARAGTLPVDELSGSTFTVSNLGMYGVESFAAIINPGESGILAVGAAVEAPTAIAGGLAVRTLMKLTLTADHRLVDGELGARFMGALRRQLEDPSAIRAALASG